MLLKSPLKFPLTKAISCLDPKVSVNETLRASRLRSALNIFISHNVILATEADETRDQFETICEDDTFIDSCKDFIKHNKIEKEKKRLDDFWIEK